jgi:Uma2 family endonuclease
MATEKTLLTADDLLRLPDDGMRHELVRGELRTMPPAGGEHGIVAGEAFGVLRDYVRPRRLGVVFAAETGFFLAHSPDLVRAPDVAFVAAGRLQGERPPRGYVDLVPDLVVEVISPYDRAADVEEKVEDWLEAGVRLLWLVHPRRRWVTVYRSRHDIRRLTADEELDGGDVLPGFTCRVADLFPY